MKYVGSCEVDDEDVTIVADSLRKGNTITSALNLSMPE